MLLSCRRAATMPSYNEAYKPYLQRVGLYGVHLFLEMRADHDLITALVERWRPETHTFHMPEGECTLTLQDVNIISGLRIDGGVVTGWTSSNSWIEMIADFLGPRLEAGSAHMKGSQLKLTWLTQTFNELPPHPTPLDIERYARAYMLCLIGGFLFPNKSTRYVHLMWLPLLANFNNAGMLSWGSACLAWLYRELCRASHAVAEQLSGAYFILQIWAWEHFPIISRTPVDHVPWDDDDYIELPYGLRWIESLPQPGHGDHNLEVYRYQFDRLAPNEIIWQPYQVDIILRAIRRTPGTIAIAWDARVPLLCFHIVEWHFPDRVMRQFGFHQHLPIDVPSNMVELHKIDLRANEHNWPVYHREYINLWNSRHTLRMNGIPLGDYKQGYHDEYMQWYRTITRRWISHKGAMHGSVVDGTEHINIRTHNRDELGRDDTTFVRDTSSHMLRALREDRCDTIRYVPSHAPPQPEPQANPVLHDAAPRRQTGRRAQPRERLQPDPRVVIPPPWAYPFPPAETGADFTTPIHNIIRPSHLYGVGGSSCGVGFHGSSFVYPSYGASGSGSASGSYNHPPSYHSPVPPNWFGENMYTPTPPQGTPSFIPTTYEGGSQAVEDPPQLHDHNDEESPSTIHKRLRKKKHPKKRGCCPTD